MKGLDLQRILEKKVEPPLKPNPMKFNII